MHRCSLFSILIFIVARVSSGEETKDQLPVPGTWVKYQINSTYVFENEPEKTKSCEVKFLDRVMIDDQAYRWIEFRIDHQTDPDDDWAIGVDKFLIPEAALLTKPNPFRLMEKAYEGIGKRTGEWYGGAPRLLTKQDANAYVYQIRSANYSMGPFLQGLKSRRKLSRSFEDAKTVPYQRGNLKCTKRLDGTLQGLEPDERERFLTSWDADYQVWINDEVPLGIAEAKIRRYRTEYFTNPKRELVIEESKVEVYLMDFGTGAKSAIPDSR